MNATKAFSNPMKIKQAGLGLIEILIYLAIAGSIILGVFKLASNARTSSEDGDEITTVQAVVTKVRGGFTGKPSYTGVSTSFVVHANGFPDNMVSGTTVSNRWGGTVTVATGAPVTTFNIVYTGVPTANCIGMVNGLGASFNTISVGNTVVKAANTSSTDAAAADTACSSSSTVDVTFNSL